MSILGGLTKAVIGVVALPVAAVADVVTLGGVLSDQKRTYTARRAEQVMDALDEATGGTNG